MTEDMCLLVISAICSSFLPDNRNFRLTFLMMSTKVLGVQIKMDPFIAIFGVSSEQLLKIRNIILYFSFGETLHFTPVEMSTFIIETSCNVIAGAAVAYNYSLTVG